MTNSDSFVEMALSSIRCFNNDGELDMGELNYLIGLAMRDGEIDDDEKHVLSDVFARALALPELDPRVQKRIEHLKVRYEID